MIVSDKPITQILSRLKNSQRPYLITGSLASFRYHRWLSSAPKIVELRIYSEDYNYWVNLLQGEAIYISETPPTTEMMQCLDVAILLTRNLNAQTYQNKRTFADLHYESPEDLCIDFLMSLVAEITIMEILAILLVQREVFRWDYFCAQVKVFGLTRETGILLEVMNEHTLQNLMPQRVIDHLFHESAKNDGLIDFYFPHTWRVKLALKRQREKDLAITYPRTSQKWGIKVVLPRYIMDKLVLDLDYVWRDHVSIPTADFENRQTVSTIFS